MSVVLVRLEPHYVLQHGYEMLHGYVWTWRCWGCGTTGDTSQTDGPPTCCTNCDNDNVRVIRAGDPESFDEDDA